MDPDLSLVIGVLLGVFSLPSMVSAFAERRAPRVASVTIITAGAFVLWALNQNPGVYTITGFPDVLISVVGSFME